MSKKSRPCEICMKPIEPQRLEATPETRLCKEHAEKIEKHVGEFIRVVSHERTSKAGSLKKNYGGVNTSRKRNQAAIEKLKDEFDEEKWQQKPV
ncbi:MAG: hypothetical protein FJ303_08750 [Planctomycetes bacterium]|nr:hypothetical protein [Planctomycetota bacterium]